MLVNLTAQLAAKLAAPLQRRLPAGGDERGAALVEYAFLVALIAIVCLLALVFFGNETSELFSKSASSLPN